MLPKIDDYSFNKVVEINKNFIDDTFKSTSDIRSGEFWSKDYLNDLDSNDDQKMTLTSDNRKRIDFLNYFLRYRSKNHTDLINFDIFQKMIPLSSVKIIMDKPFFINFNIKESSSNILLEQQGLLLKAFLRLYLMRDMKNMPYIDSYNTEINNPIDRQRIRKFNKDLPFVQNKYFELKDQSNYSTSTEFNIVGFCFQLIDNYFPDISGIWANYNHIAHINTLEIIRVCFEYGFFNEQQSKEMIIS